MTAEGGKKVKQMLAREASQSSLSSISVDLAGQKIQEKKKNLSLGFMLKKPSKEITEAAKESDESNQGVHENTDDEIQEQVTQSSVDGKDQRIKEKKKNLSLGFMLRRPPKQTTDDVEMTNIKSLNGEESLQVITLQMIP